MSVSGVVAREQKASQVLNDFNRLDEPVVPAKRTNGVWRALCCGRTELHAAAARCIVVSAISLDQFESRPVIDDELKRAEQQQQLRERALARWDDDGGGAPEARRESDVPELSNAEVVQLRVRVIALENLVIALLADGPERQLAKVREMAAFITPRPGQTQHPLTVDAASHMLGLVHRAGHFRTDFEGGGN